MIGIILAGGKSKRFNSEKSKVLHELLGKPVLSYSIDTLKSLGIEDVYIVVGGKSKDEIMSRFQKEVKVVDQKIPLGTGDAVKKVLEKIKDIKGEDVLILPGDAPLLKAETLKKFIEFHLQEKPDCSIMTTVFQNSKGYGRIIKENSRVIKIVEELDASEEEKKIKEVNAGVYIFKREILEKVINRIEPNNKKGEYYLTDCIHIINSLKGKILAFKTDDHEECMGINKRDDFVKAFKVMKKRIIDEFIEKGVTILDPDNTYIESEVEIGRDSVIYPFVFLKGKTRIGKNCEIGPFVYLENKVVKDGEKIRGGEQ